MCRNVSHTYYKPADINGNGVAWCYCRLKTPINVVFYSL